MDIEDLGLNTLPEGRTLGPISPQQLQPAALHKIQQTLQQQQQRQQNKPKPITTTTASSSSSSSTAVPAVHAGGVIAPTNLPDLLAAMRGAAASGVPFHIIAGNTGAGIYPSQWQSAAAAACALVKHVQELQRMTLTGQADLLPPHSLTKSMTNLGLTVVSDHSKQGLTLEVGAAVTLTKLQRVLEDVAAAVAAGGVVSGVQAAENVGYMVRHLGRVAGTLVRNAATLGGHLALVRSRGLESDVMPMMMATGGGGGRGRQYRSKWLGGAGGRRGGLQQAKASECYEHMEAPIIM